VRISEFIAIALAALAVSAAAQDKRGAAIAKPFVLSQADLPRGFKGHSCAALAARLKPLKLEKSKFESTTDYERRAKKSMDDLMLAPGVKGSDLIALVVPPTVLQREMSYDADSRTATFGYDRIAMAVGGLVVLDMSRPPTFTINILSEQRTPFVGTNAFGARVSAERLNRKLCAVALANHTRDSIQTFSSATVKMEPQAAKELTEAFGVLFIGRVAAPLYAHGFDARSATIDSPIQFHADADVIPLELVDIWYFNRRTGAVVARVRPEPVIPPAAPAPEANPAPAAPAGTPVQQ
jgi:hypothetical protein